MAMSKPECEAQVGLPWARAIAFIFIAAYFTLGPFAKQLVGFRGPGLRSWKMYSVVFPVCDVRYAKGPLGKQVPIDRFETLGRERERAPLSLRRIEDPTQIQRVGDTLCEALGSEADVRAFARCASDDGWVVVESGDRNLCEVGDLAR